MPLDVNDLVAFYASPLGDVTRRLIGRVLRARWDDCRGLSILGLGFAGPLLERFRDQAQRTLALMPAEVGVARWPAQTPPRGGNQRGGHDHPRASILVPEGQLRRSG